MTHTYRQHLIEAVKCLTEAEQLLFTSALNIAWSGELSQLADAYEEGDVMTFDLPLLRSVDDLNVKKIMELLTPLTEAIEYLKNVNKLTSEEIDGTENLESN